jgi:hypothetical protein
MDHVAYVTEAVEETVDPGSDRHCLGDLCGGCGMRRLIPDWRKMTWLFLVVNARLCARRRRMPRSTHPYEQC